MWIICSWQSLPSSRASPQQSCSSRVVLEDAYSSRNSDWPAGTWGKVTLPKRPLPATHQPLCLLFAVPLRQWKYLTAVCAITPKTGKCLLSALPFHKWCSHPVLIWPVMFSNNTLDYSRSLQADPTNPFPTLLNELIWNSCQNVWYEVLL